MGLYCDLIRLSDEDVKKCLDLNNEAVDRDLGLIIKYHQ